MKVEKLGTNSIRSHIAVWVLLMVYVATTQFVKGTLISQIIYTPLFILNYVIPFYVLTLVVFPNFFERQKMKFFLYYFGVILLFILIDFIHIRNILPMLGGYRKRIYVSDLEFLQTSLLHFGWVAFASTGRYLMWRSFEMKKRNILKTETLLSLELKFLNNQFHSHLAFNFFSFCYSKLMKLSNDAAESIITFTQTLQYSLNLDGEVYIPLSEEIEYLENWISIQKLITSDIYISLETVGNCDNFCVLKGLLSIPIENAFKHGNYSDQHNPIKIHFEIDNEHLNFKIQNRKVNSDLVPTTGFGMDNLKQLLNMFYRNIHSLEVFVNELEYSINLKLKNKLKNEIY
jgi:hypothetical protein